MAQEGESSFVKQVPPANFAPTTIMHGSHVAYNNQPPPYSAPGYPMGPPHQPPYPPYGPPGPTVQATVVPMTVVVPAVGSKPSVLTCKSCNTQMVSRVETKASLRTHMMALLLCLFGCWPCVFVPYCMDSCNNMDHYCTNCGAYIGTHIS